MFHILQTNYFLVFLIVFYTSRNKVFANVQCITIRSGVSQQSDDARTYASCPSYSTMVSCGGITSDSTAQSFDGTFIDTSIFPARCYAQNPHTGNGVYAYARCCNFKPTDINCIYSFSNMYSDNADDAIISTHCGTNTYNIMLGCTVHTMWGYLDGSYPGYASVQPSSRSQFDTHNYPHYNQCTAQNAADGGGVKANLACCKSPTYTLTCLTRYGSPTYPVSSVTCPNGYFMSNCAGWSLYRINGWWISRNNGQDTCLARSPVAKDVYSAATCCKLETDSPTSDPTPSPTPSPTPAPTIYPTKYPTKIPTVSVSNNMPTVTYKPTNIPTNVGEQSETEATESNVQYIHVKTEKDNSAMIGGLIGALVTLLFCICCIGGIIGWYFWRKRKMDNEMKDVNKDSDNEKIMSSIDRVSFQAEGSNGTSLYTGNNNTNNKGYETLEQKDNMLIPSLPNENENVNLLMNEIDTHDDSDELIIQNGIQHDTRLLSVDEDEDVLPNDDDNN